MSGERPKKIGRPSKLTPALSEEMLALIEGGDYPEDAALIVGITRDTYYSWKAKGEEDAAAGRRSAFSDFSDSVSRARAKARSHAVATMRKAADNGDARFALEYLARTDPEHWAKRDNLSIEHNGKLAVREEGNGELMRRIAADPQLLSHLTAIEAGLLGADQPGRADEPGEQGPVEGGASPDAAQR